VKIPVTDAEAYFAHPSQRRGAMLDGPLPDDAMYHARSGVCLVFNWTHWPGVLMAHIGVMPSAWGRVTDAAKLLLIEAWREYQPTRIVAWCLESNRAVVALIKRLGFSRDGGIPLVSPVACYGWSL